MIRKSQTGFTLTYVLLVIGILAIISAIGWYIWSAQTNTTTESTTATNETNTVSDATKPATSTATDETAGWLQYQTPNSTYSLRLADGWKLNQCNDSSLLFTYEHSSVTPKPGEQAVVTNIDCASDGGGDGLFISFYDPTTYDAATGPVVRTFKTDAGDTVQLYSHVEDTVADGMGGLDKGGTYYTYIVTKSATKAVTVSYGVNPGQTDDHETVEQAIKTIVIN